jgi:hypothetical protein
LPLKNGVYTPKTAVTVTYWPAPDADGDGDDLIQDEFDGQGNYLGQVPVEEGGKPVRHYVAPDGFQRVPISTPGADGASESWVRGNGRGQVHRDRNGSAVGIKEGTALLEYPDGTHKLLTSAFAMRVFEAGHELAGGTPEEEATS